VRLGRATIDRASDQVGIVCSGVPLQDCRSKARRKPLHLAFDAWVTSSVEPFGNVTVDPCRKQFGRREGSSLRMIRPQNDELIRPCWLRGDGKSGRSYTSAPEGTRFATRILARSPDKPWVRRVDTAGTEAVIGDPTDLVSISGDRWGRRSVLGAGREAGVRGQGSTGHEYRECCEPSGCPISSRIA